MLSSPAYWAVGSWAGLGIRKWSLVPHSHPRPLHRAHCTGGPNEGRGWALCWRNCTGGRIQLGHGHYAHPIWMGARGWALRAHNGGFLWNATYSGAREGTKCPLCRWPWRAAPTTNCAVGYGLGQATQWWVGPSDTT